jgi:hypothetical protein
MIERKKGNRQDLNASFGVLFGGGTKVIEGGGERW